MKRGLYILANDGVLDWLVALLNSIRLNAKALAVCIIPYDDKIAATTELGRRYGFEIYADHGELKRCDEMSIKFHGESRGYYRKFACWGGGFDEFVYIDVDSVLTRHIDWLFRNLTEWDIIFSDGPCPANKPYVWKPSMSETGRFNEVQLSFSANAGFFVSTKRKLSMAAIESCVDEALLYREHMDMGSSDQPFLNFVILALGMKYSSVAALNAMRGVHTKFWSIWGGSMGALSIGPRIYSVYPKKKVLFPPRAIFLVHWAGKTTKERSLNSAWVDLTRDNYTSRGELVTWFRYQSLWNYYAFDRAKASGVTLKDLRRLPNC